MTNMVSYFDKTYSLSLLVPEGWSAGSHEQFPLQFTAPVENGYRTNLNFALAEGVGPLTPESFQQIIANTHADQQADYHAFSQMSEQKIMLDGLPAYVQVYEWQDEASGTSFAQVLALVATGPDTLLEIHGATLHQMAATAIPILLAMIESIRFIPPTENTGEANG
jgi:hypothetical protein